MIEKLDLKTPNFTDEHIANIAAMFPHCVTEVEDENGRLKKAIDFDLLKQELSAHIVKGPKERYRIDWPGKRASLVSANTPITKTLRPAVEESVNFDTTQNLYIEGDNLEALKLLQESYLGAIKMIYIDPPYNTGKDFVYKDNFTRSKEEELEASGQVDEEGGRLVANPDSNGRFHSDWLSMMYPRLRLARNLLKDDGVIFISIDDNEVHNLRKICDEVFGEGNFRNTIIVKRRVKSLNSQFASKGLQTLNVGFEYVLVYSKSNLFLMQPLRVNKNNASSKGRWDVFWSNADRPTLRYDILGFTPKTGQWRYSQEKALIAVENYLQYQKYYSDKMTLEEYWEKTGRSLRFIRRIDNGKGKNGGVQHWIPPSKTSLRTSNWSDIEVSQIHKEVKIPFDNPKNKLLPQELIKLSNAQDGDIILDFFSGSATTAHAVMQLNAEDGGNRKFIMVQLPEETDEKSEAYKAGYKTIAEIGKERIRRAGKKIIEDLEVKIENEKDENEKKRLHEIKSSLDTGFRVLKIDSSNIKDVYFTPDKVDKQTLFKTVNHIKQDRTPEDLLFGVLVNWGVDLSLPIQREEILGKTVFFVGHDTLTACFDEDLDINFIKELAKREALRVIFKESGFKDDETKINAEQIFKQLSLNTDLRVI